MPLPLGPLRREKEGRWPGCDTGRKVDSSGQKCAFSFVCVILRNMIEISLRGFVEGEMCSEFSPMVKFQIPFSHI